MRAVDWDAGTGRGLVLVDAVADRWGTAERNGPGKLVWAECAASPVSVGGGARGGE
jgi:hypothetical protein